MSLGRPKPPTKGGAAPDEEEEEEERFRLSTIYSVGDSQYFLFSARFLAGPPLLGGGLSIFYRAPKDLLAALFPDMTT